VGSSGNRGYEGSCPPKPREHGYSFRLYALDKVLNLPAGSTKATIESAMKGYILEQTELIGRYKRI